MQAFVLFLSGNQSCHGYGLCCPPHLAIKAEAFSYLTPSFGVNICLKQQRLALQHQTNVYLEPKWLRCYICISCDRGTQAAPKVRCVKNPIFDFLQNGSVVVLVLAMIFVHAAVNRVSDACK